MKVLVLIGLCASIACKKTDVAPQAGTEVKPISTSPPATSATRTMIDRLAISVEVPAGLSVKPHASELIARVGNADETVKLEHFDLAQEPAMGTLAGHKTLYASAPNERTQEWATGYLIIGTTPDDRPEMLVVERVKATAILCTATGRRNDPWLATAERICRSIKPM